MLWIDSICINQRNVDENFNQIRLMKDIYSKAFMVSVCLHPPENPKDETAEHIESALAADLVDELLLTDLKFYANEKAIFDRYAPRSRGYWWVAFKNLLWNE